jgi:hypothetical protein
MLLLLLLVTAVLLSPVLLCSNQQFDFTDSIRSMSRSKSFTQGISKVGTSKGIRFVSLSLSLSSPAHQILSLSLSLSSPAQCTTSRSI